MLASSLINFLMLAGNKASTDLFHCGNVDKFKKSCLRIK